MIVFTNPAHSADRPAFVDAFPTLREAHRAAQKAMFGAAHKADLPTNEIAADFMVDGINQLLGLSIGSRRQLTIDEMDAVTVAIEANAFNGRWETSVRAEIVYRTEIRLTVVTQRPRVCPEAAARIERMLDLWN